MSDYVHGYSAREAERLSDQASVLRDLLHEDGLFAPGARVLEPGCGTGAQSQALLAGNPGIRLTCMDIEASQLDRARARLGPSADGVEFQCGDLVDAPFPPASFDNAFICFVLEHLADPSAALAAVRRLVRPGGKVVIIEGDHGSSNWAPETPEALTVWRALVQAQRRLGGDPMIGRRLHGLLTRAGFRDVKVEPKLIYADAGAPELRRSFVRQVIGPMVGAVREAALAVGDADETTWAAGMEGLMATDADETGVFCYTFFRATAQA